MILIHVSGKPAPQGSKVRNRAGAIYESNNRTGPWREAVRAETQRIIRAMAGPPYIQGEAVEVWLLFRMARPAGHYGSGRNASNLRAGAPIRPAVTPDGDKLARAVFDGITEGGAIADDKQIADYHVSKDYCYPGETPSADIRIEPAAAVPAVERRLFEVIGPGRVGTWQDDAGPGWARFGADDTPEAIEAKMEAALGHAKLLLDRINGSAL